MRREVMVIVESRHIEIDHACDVEPEGLIDHVECNAALNLTWVYQESLFVNIGCEEVHSQMKGRQGIRHPGETG